MRRLLLTISFVTAFFTIAYCSDCYKTTKSVNIRSGAGTNYSILITLNEGEEIEVVDKSNSNWYQVKTNSITGFVASQYLTDCVTNNSKIQENALIKFITDYKIPLTISLVIIILIVFLATRGRKAETFDEPLYPDNSVTSYPQRPIVTRSTKSVGLAMFLAIIFPYFGVLYATVSGFFWLFFSYIGMWGLLLYYGFKTLNDGVLFIGLILSIIHFIVSIIWAGIAANSYNKRIIYGTNY